MDRTTIFVVLTTLVGAAILSGCTAAAHPQGTAKDVEPPADQAASSWAADAELVTIVGLEGDWTGAYGGYTSHSWEGETGSSYSFSGSARSDPHVGDGACQLWVFRYISESKDRALDVVVGGNGTVIAQDEDGIDEDDVPIGHYKVNSDEAIAKARKASPDLDEAIDDGLLLVLDRDDEEDRSVWIVMAGGGDGGGFAIIDAVSGDVIFAMGDDYGGYGGYSGYGSYGGYGA